MNKQAIEIIVSFLERIDLKGSEVTAFNVAMDALKEEYNVEPVAPAPVVEKKPIYAFQKKTQEKPIEFKEEDEEEELENIDDEEAPEEPIEKPRKAEKIPEDIFDRARRTLKDKK